MTITIIVIAFFVLLALFILLKTVSLPEEYYKRQLLRNELRKQVIKLNMPPEEVPQEQSQDKS